jgi:RNA polymerase sigma-70 factor (ECF subfamily)
LNDGRPDAEALLGEVARHRDKAAFAQLFTWFAPRVKGQLMAAGVDAGGAEDLAQEILFTVWKKAHLYDPLRGAASTWIYAMARNRFLNTRRSKASTETDLFDPIAPIADPQEGAAGAAGRAGDAAGTGGEAFTGEAVIVARERDRMLRSALLELPEEQRQALQDIYFSEQSMRESAEKRGLPVGTVKTRVRLALERLRVVVTRGWQA